MKQLSIILGLLVAVRALGDNEVMVKLDHVSAMGTRSNMWFMCALTIHNGTSTHLTATNLFIGPPGLALKISDLDGKELKRVYADPFINDALNSPIIPPGNLTFKEPYGLSVPFPLPESVQSVRVRIEGELSYAGYTVGLTSNIVEVHIP
jgi:hypothetical protein